jgi:hypothetical protein
MEKQTFSYEAGIQFLNVMKMDENNLITFPEIFHC